MINRCIYCGDIAPDFSDMCDTCAKLESELQDEVDDFFEPEFYIGD
ncbi:MAG: hypothetical protein ACFFG0_22910 [Candidatus Thorarchaeota archaeon]